MILWDRTSSRFSYMSIPIMIVLLTTDPLPIRDLIPITDWLTSLPLIIQPSPTNTCVHVVPSNLLGDNILDLVNTGLRESYKLNLGKGIASSRFASKNERMVPISVQYPSYAK